MFLTFTERELAILRVIMSYAYSNLDDLNEAVEDNADEPVTENEVDALMVKICRA